MPLLRALVVLVLTGLLLVSAAPPLPAAPGRTATPPVPGAVVPGAVVPGAVVPGAVVPGAVVPGAVVPAAGYGWPLAGTPTLTRPFDPPATVYGPGHRGVDLAGADGAVVLAAGAGVVAFAGSVAGRPVVSVDHPDGVRTTYEPVAPVVAAGQVVARGSPLGVLQAGHAGCPVEACLHWGARVGEVYLDPLLLLTPPRVRLLPWG